jgi:uncharacterized membrane protein
MADVLAPSAAPPFEAPHFEALITPHRSMGPAGLRRLVAFILIVSSAVSTGLYCIGAWPVIGFNGAEIGLAILLLRRNARQRDTSERLILSATRLRIIRTDPKGRQQTRALNGAWLNAVLQERPGRTPALLLVERGRQLEVGTDLGETEKRDLAEALKAALYRQRNPRFDNPQL